MIFAFIGLVTGAVAASAGAVAAGATWAWQASGLGRGRRRAGRAVKPVRKEAARVDRTLDKWRKRVEPEARIFAAARLQARLTEIPIDALKDAGATNVRWAVFEDAGIATLHDVEGRTVQELAELPGVGQATAEKVVRAAAELGRRVRADATDFPRADLDQPGADKLADRTLDLLEAGDAGGDAPRRVAQAADEFEQRLHDVRKESGFGRWLTSAWNKPRTEASVQEANELAAEADALVADGLLDQSAEGRKRMRKWKRPKRDRDTLLSRFRDRYTECCTLLERVFVALGLRQRKISKGQGGLSDEVARRVERFPLRAAAMRVRLRSYQEFGAKYMLAQERTILGDEMGLGKTMQALAMMTHGHEKDARSRFFVVAPAGLLINWLREVEKFTPLRGYLIHGNQAKGSLETWAKEGGVAVTSFATLRNLDLGRSLAETGGTVDVCIVDEAHFIKNPDAGRTQAVRRLLECSVQACLMSGTPMENRPSEFLHLIDAVRPSDAADLRGQDLDLDAAAGSVGAFHRAVAKVYLRRNQEDVLSELPDKIEVEEWVELSGDERNGYLDKVRDGNFMGMRQAATVCATNGVSAKIDRLAELLEDHRASGRRVIVFSFFLGVLGSLAKRFESDVVGTISGRVSPEDKQALCDEFQARDGHAILLLQIQAGGQGLNLQRASAVVLMEPQTKPSTEAQAIARAHRMGQTERVLVHRLLARGTCDESLLTILAEKQELFDAYARKSLVKEASAQATETSLTKAVVEAEQARLRDEETPASG